jgi:maltooligosyltrehalose trehalohydrolase
MAVVLDVVYNHIGPEGNYLGQFAPYFTDRYRTPWGEALNFDGPGSDDVRRYFIENALAWVTDFHFDALRLDAIHAIVDASANPFLRELGEAVHHRAAKLGRKIHVIPESDLNDSRVLRPLEQGGFGLDAQWNDDFHHCLHVLLTGEREGYYADFGRVEQLAQAFTSGFVYSGQYSNFRRRRHGNSSHDLAAQQFVVCAQNHDQVGNRCGGERLTALADFESLKLAAGVVLLSPFIPLLFMGEEYGETAPFLYFTSHNDPTLIEAVRKGRREEFARFNWKAALPDPQAEETFSRSRIQWELRRQGQHNVLREFHREMLSLRRRIPALARLDKNSMKVAPREEAKLLTMHRWSASCEIFAAFHFGEQPAPCMLTLPTGRWKLLLDSSDPKWLGVGSHVPREIVSSGNVHVNLAARSLLLFSRRPKQVPARARRTSSRSRRKKN